MKVFLFNKPYGGGPKSFLNLLEQGMSSSGVEFIYSPKTPSKIILIISATRHLIRLLIYKFKGKKVIQRLDGYNWKGSIKTEGLISFLKSNAQNGLMMFCRLFIADIIVYQSSFLQKEWNSKFRIYKRSCVIKNSAGENFFEIARNYPRYNKIKPYRLVCVEGEISNDPRTISYLSALEHLKVSFKEKIESIHIFGSSRLINTNQFENLVFHGLVKKNQLIDFYKDANLIFIVLELIPPCPNALIEAMSCGLPSIGFNEGSYLELAGTSGELASSEFPARTLSPEKRTVFNQAFQKIDNNYELYSNNAKNRSLEYFHPSVMNQKYLEIFKSLET